MYIIVGLGNPGPRYQLTRHNIGFLVVDALVQHLNARPLPEKFNAHTYEFKDQDLDIKFVKPQTYMNLSGDAVQPIMAFYKVPIENLLVVYDEVDLPFGKMKLVRKRGEAGHNGIKSIHEKLGTNEYARLRLGVGRPPIPQMKVADWVLQNFGKEQDSELSDFIGRAAEGILSFVEEGFERAQNTINSSSDGDSADGGNAG